ncbi:MAG: hypothetical protein EZS28_033550 [Streblomastix strix]|uniref:Uncharacterized protein n=1 Tax=Streblomastix strix TaxID=222440 RepID=A0A5J4UL44_9EUKA|nr:MAG: hypothetical protein EZS28_033550 [Streblomastix strix]
MVGNTLNDNGKSRGNGKQRGGLDQRNENSEEESESSSGEDIGFRGQQCKEGATLFRQVLKQSGLSNDAVQTIIDN